MLSTALAITLATAAAAAGPPEHREKTGWIVLRISQDQHTLLLSYVSGGCGHRGRANVRETPDAVRIKVTQLQPDPGPGVACTLDLQLKPLRVKLKHRLAGRRLHGQAKRFPADWPMQAVERDDRLIPIVPNLVGLASADALRTLHAQHYRPRLATRSGTVTGEDPQPGTLVPDRRITLVTEP